MKIKQEKQEFSPVQITLETQREAEAFFKMIQSLNNTLQIHKTRATYYRRSIVTKILDGVEDIYF